jgi:multidrug transporter EmrE-like cation transporter
MTLLALLLILLAHSCNVAGQIVMKTAIHAEGRWNRLMRFTLAIGGMTLSFFLTLGLLQRFDLSYLYPFQASSVILMAVGARVFLGETLSRRNLLAMGFIVAGIALVSSS